MRSRQPRLLGLCGLAGSGKSTIAQYLCDAPNSWWLRRRFAGPLKEALRAMGLSEAQVDGPLKETPSPLLCGKTPRHAMQTLGTEWGRRCIGEDFWIGLWRAQVEAALARDWNVVVDDVRFTNEAEAIRALGGEIKLVHRPGILLGTHPSETEILKISFDGIIHNNSDLSTLHALIHKQYL